jgi:hypothetical protein
MQRPVQGGKMKGWVRDVCVRVWGGEGGGGGGEGGFGLSICMYLILVVGFLR